MIPLALNIDPFQGPALPRVPMPGNRFAPTLKGSKRTYDALPRMPMPSHRMARGSGPTVRAAFHLAPPTGQRNTMQFSEISAQNFGRGALARIAQRGAHLRGMPGYAYGGRPEVGEPAIVGENGPEVFVPDEPGTIIPNQGPPMQMAAMLPKRGTPEFGGAEVERAAGMGMQARGAYQPRLKIESMKEYYDRVPQDMRLTGSGVSHPGFRWEVFDKQTGQVVGSPYTNSRRATTRVDKLDNDYGGYRYGKRIVPSPQITDKEIETLRSLGIID